MELTTTNLALEVSQNRGFESETNESMNKGRSHSAHTPTAISSLLIPSLDNLEGHEILCRYLLEEAGECAADLANAKSWTNNTPLMFAVWARSLDAAKVLISYGADPHHINDKGCHTAHWATAGGDVDICKFLYEVEGVDFYEPDTTGDRKSVV